MLINNNLSSKAQDKSFLISLLLGFLILTMSTLSFAEKTANKDDILALVSNAYGGNKLLSLKSFQTIDELRQTYPGQGYSPEFDDFWTVKLQVDFDLKNSRGNSERWAEQYGRIFHERNTHTDDNRITTNYMSNTKSEGEATDYYRDMGPDIRVSDTMLAYELARLKDTAKYNGIVFYRGVSHHQITYELPSSPTLNLLVNVETGLISKMYRYVEAYETHVNYLFENHSTHKGVAFAQDVRIYFNNNFSSLVKSRKIELNKVKPSAFTIDTTLMLEPTPLDMSEMSFTTLSDNVHHVGVDGYSVFIDAGDHIIGVGGSEGIKTRFEHYQEQQQNNKPLRYQIVTHHHSDHLEGVIEAYEMGANLVFPVELVRNMKEQVPDLDDTRTITFDKPMSLGPVQLYTFGSSHAAVNTLTYIPEAKAIFQADHYASFHTNYAQPLGRPSYQMYAAVVSLNLDINSVLSAHSSKVEKWSEFAVAADNYNANNCPSNRSICN